MSTRSFLLVPSARRMALNHLDSGARTMAFIYEDLKGDPDLMSRLIDAVERLGWRFESQSASESALAIPKMLGSQGHWVTRMDPAPRGGFTTHRSWDPGRQIMLPPEIQRSRKVTLIFRNQILGLEASAIPPDVQAAIAAERATIAAEEEAEEAERREARQREEEQSRARALNAVLRRSVRRHWRRWLPIGTAVLSPVLVLAGALLPASRIYYLQAPPYLDFASTYAFHWRRVLSLAGGMCLLAIATRIVARGPRRSWRVGLATIAAASASAVGAGTSLYMNLNWWAGEGIPAAAKAANMTLRAARLLKDEGRVVAGDLVLIHIGPPVALAGVALALLGMTTWSSAAKLATQPPSDYELCSRTAYLRRYGRPLRAAVLGPLVVVSVGIAVLGLLVIRLVGSHPEMDLPSASLFGFIGLLVGTISAIAAWRRGLASD